MTYQLSARPSAQTVSAQAAPGVVRPDVPASVRSGRRSGVGAIARRAVHWFTDRGWLGLTPLRTHMVICGFPRSGSTLLLLMAETCMPGAKTFHRERTALGQASDNYLGRHELMITKRPNDVFWIDELRHFYRGRPTVPRFIVTVRDPRAVLTSAHEGRPGEYYVTPERWRHIHQHVLFQREFDDVMVVEFADLVTGANVIQQRLAQFIGYTIPGTFDEFHTRVPAQFDKTALNQVRPLDPSTLDKWRAAKHRDRIRSLLQAMPDLPDILVALGYEPDTAWVDGYK